MQEWAFSKESESWALISASKWDHPSKILMYMLHLFHFPPLKARFFPMYQLCSLFLLHLPSIFRYFSLKSHADVPLYQIYVPSDFWEDFWSSIDTFDFLTTFVLFSCLISSHVPLFSCKVRWSFHPFCHYSFHAWDKILHISINLVLLQLLPTFVQNKVWKCQIYWDLMVDIWVGSWASIQQLDED